ncbi:hypothetical protein CLPUN_35470 [Clostridium puniceum]|uniref:Uncharacterized protein n=1 Tax=Clostridium puniceum TaxID=29367 RepID=A0A1S8TBF0_9CLOT|nr:hypothetical protein [Clostridium puniceum]OOM75110.1 hypothetical protein CLPUN_35470 [Clostridium puniceum]
MSRDDDFTNEAGDDLKKDFKNIFKHGRRAFKGFFRGRNSKCFGRPNGCTPFGFGRSTLLALFYPKLIVAGIIILTLLFCGVSLYGVIIVLLLAIIFILI